jgi:hypothetical protein
MREKAGVGLGLVSVGPSSPPSGAALAGSRLSAPEGRAAARPRTVLSVRTS